MKVVVTIAFALISTALTYKAAGGYAAGAVLFGLWAIAGIFETTRQS